MNEISDSIEWLCKKLIKFKISPITIFTLNDLHQTKVEDTKNSFSPFTGKFIPQIIIRVIIRNPHDIARHRYYKISLKPITRLEANLIAQRALYRLRPRGKLWPGSKSLEIERARPREYALPSWRLLQCRQLPPLPPSSNTLAFLVGNSIFSLRSVFLIPI